MFWDMVGNACLIAGTITVPASIAASYPSYVPVIGLTVAALGGIGKAIIQKMSTPQGQQQLASDQQLLINAFQKLAALPPDQRNQIIQNLPAFLSLFTQTTPTPTVTVP